MSDEVVAQVTKLEKATRQAVEERLAAGEYDLAQSLLVLVRDVAALKPRFEALFSGHIGSPDVRAARTAGSTGYPRFFVEGDQLVKVGESKKNPPEYRHKVRRDSVVEILDVLRDTWGGEQRPFTQKELQEHCNPIPSLYHVQVVTGVLVHLGLVEKQGRDSYRVKPGEPSNLSGDHLWRLLQ